MGIKLDKALLLLTILLVAGCVSGGLTGQTGTPQAGETGSEEAVVEEPPKLPIGLTLGVGAPASTAVLDVTVKSAEIANSYTTDAGTVTASAGKTFILIDVEIRHKGSIAVDAGRGKFFATDANMQDRYGSSYSGTDGLVGSANLVGDDVISGKAAFEVPEGLPGLKVVYEFGTDITVTNMVAWNIS